jgi:hypothetical protein
VASVESRQQRRAETRAATKKVVFAQGKVVNFSGLARPTDKQRSFWQAIKEHKFTLYGGARGGGKSYILRWTAIKLLLEWAAQGHHNVRVGIFCETFPTLNERQLNRAIMGRREEIYPDWLGYWHKTEHEFRLFPQYGGGVVCFRNLDDPAKYRSAEFAAILIDELTRNKVEVFTDLIGSLRWPGIEHTPFIAASNPTGIGHTWVKDVFVDQSFEMEESQNLIAPDPYSGDRPYSKEDFGYVKALATDNPHNSQSYIRTLRSLPPRLREAFFNGNWDVFEGQAFDEWNAAVHVVPNRLNHLKGWRIVAGLDWGWRKGYVCLVAISPDGDLEVIHEIVFKHIYAKAAAKAFARRWDNFGMNPELILADEQMWQDASHQFKGATTLADQFMQGLIEHYGDLEKAPTFAKGPKGKNSRKVKFDLMHRYLKYEMDPVTHEIHPWNRPLLRVQRRCKYLRRTLPSLPVDPDKPEDDVDTHHPDDHAYDAVGFILLAQLELPESELDQTYPHRHPGFDPKRKKRRPRHKRVEEALGVEPSEDAGYTMPRANYSMPGHDQDVTLTGSGYEPAEGD